VALPLPDDLNLLDQAEEEEGLMQSDQHKIETDPKQGKTVPESTQPEEVAETENIEIQNKDTNKLEQ
jgi:hypothetical protein